MKKSIRFISVFIALTLIALSLPVSFACPPPFDELDAEIQIGRECPTEFVRVKLRRTNTPLSIRLRAEKRRELNVMTAERLILIGFVV